MGRIAQRREAKQSSSADYSETVVVSTIEDRIRRGVYAPGSRVPAERVLAAEFGVSRRFVRMAYSQLVEQGLIEKPHYRRPFVALTPNTQRRINGATDETVPTVSSTIAAVLPSHPVFPGGLAIVAGIHKALTEIDSPYRLSFIDTFHKDRPEVLRRELKAIDSILGDGISGLIWWHYCDEATAAAVIGRYNRTPIVFIDRLPGILPCDFVGIDDIDSSRTAVEYLVDLGHRRIAHLMDPGKYSTILSRAQGYMDALTSHGLPVEEELIVHLNWDDDRMIKAFDQLFSLAEPPTALFASNDYIAHEFIKVAECRGVCVPNDLSVMGHGNIDRYTPREFLTSVDQPFEKIGHAAARLLLRRLSSVDASPGYQQIILPATVAVRHSCQKREW